MKSMKNTVLKSTAAIMVIIWILALHLPEEADFIGAFLNILSFLWLFLFVYANAPFEKGE